jgi:alpha-D-xyloside xylohydrolase
LHTIKGESLRGNSGENSDKENYLLFLEDEFMRFFQTARSLLWKWKNETVLIEAWGADGLRVRASMQDILDDLPGAVLPEMAVSAMPEIIFDEKMGSIVNDKIMAEITSEGVITFKNIQTSKVLLSEYTPYAGNPPARWFRPHSGSPCYQLTVCFQSQPGERFYGLGQHPNDSLDQKGCVIDQLQINTEVCIPFYLSSLGYGFLWNNPALGRVELAKNGTRWTADSTRQMDYYITAGNTPAEIIEHYTAVVGRAPLLPEWAAGFWQSRLRYYSQEQVLNIAREYRQRDLPLDVLIIDAGYWHEMGNYAFQLDQWPDPRYMVSELEKMGIRVMISVWPAINRVAPTYQIMQENGFLVRSERGNPLHIAHLLDWRPRDGPPILTLYDPTNPEARNYFWQIVKKDLYDQGIKLFWLDACEPELVPVDHDSIRYHLGSGPEVGMLYPLMHQRTFYEGLQKAGETEILTLSRSAWAGSQRFGAAVWSGDIPSTFDSLRRQIVAGLNIGLSGIVWWTTDIGGFIGGDVNDPVFQELMIRWFQYGIFCPLCRLHGLRSPIPENPIEGGAENEVWSFGEKAYGIISKLLHLREKLKPYIVAQMKKASETGLPVMRPLFIDYPDDPTCWDVEDVFLFGPDLLVAPIYTLDQRKRNVYLPVGMKWKDAWNGMIFEGGEIIQADAPLEHIPVFWRVNSKWQFSFE